MSRTIDIYLKGLSLERRLLSASNSSTTLTASATNQHNSRCKGGARADMRACGHGPASSWGCPLVGWRPFEEKNVGLSVVRCPLSGLSVEVTKRASVLQQALNQPSRPRRGRNVAFAAMAFHSIPLLQCHSVAALHRGSASPRGTAPTHGLPFAYRLHRGIAKGELSAQQ